MSAPTCHCCGATALLSHTPPMCAKCYFFGDVQPFVVRAYTKILATVELAKIGDEFDRAVDQAMRR